MATVIDPRRFTKPQLALVRHVLGMLADDYVWEDMPGATVVFHVDFSRRAPPTRLMQTSEQHFMARCFGPGAAVTRLVNAMKQLEGGTMPALLGTSGLAAFRREDLLEVLAQLAQQLGRSRPLAEHPHFDKRHHERKASFMQLCVVHGLPALHRGLSRESGPVLPEPVSIVDSLTYEGQVDAQPFGFLRDKTRAQQERLRTLTLNDGEAVDEACETWVVRDASDTGYGVELTSTPEDWVMPEMAVGLHHGSGEWQIAVIRRVARPTVETAEVGLELLSRRPRAVMLRPSDSRLSVWETAADTQTYHHTPGILLPPEAGLNEEACLLLEPGAYQLHQLYELFVDGQRRTVRLLDRLAHYGDMDQVIFSEIETRPRGT